MWVAVTARLRDSATHYRDSRSAQDHP